jgi:Fanconi anemia group M protein
VKELIEKEAVVKVKQLEVGDYVLSDDIIVERKTAEDFLQSMIDGRLFSQLLSMSTNYSMPLMIIEGSMEELFTLRNIHRNAIVGALTSIMLNYRTPILFSKDAKETAEILYITAKREQLAKDKEIRLRTGRKGLTLKEAQQFVVESLPMVGPTMAKSLLKHFGSVKAIFNASREELKQVENLGKKKASKIRKLIDAKFKEKE